MFVSGLSGAAEGQGLAAGAIVVGYGLMAGLAGVVVALLLLRSLSAKAVVRLNLIGFLLLVGLMGTLTYRYLNRDDADADSTRPANPKPTAPALTPIGFDQSVSADMGMGFFTPDFYQGGTLYFYGKPTPGKSIVNQLPWDSLVFTVSDMHQYQIDYAPPFFNPVHLKMDYEMLYFTILSEGHDDVKVVLNGATGHTAYVNKYEGKVTYWPSFILSLSTVVLLSDFPQSFKVKPLDHAGELSVDKVYTYLRPERVKGYWLEVSLLNDELKAEGRAWIRWRDEHQLLVNYSLLS